MYSRMNVIAAFQPRRELWVGTTPAQIDNEISRDCHGAGLVRGLMNEVQHQVDACSNAGARVAITVLDVETIFQNSSPRGDPTQLVITQVVRRAGVSVKKASSGCYQRSSTNRYQLVARMDCGLQPGHDGLFCRFVIRRLSRTKCASAEHYMLDIAGQHDPGMRWQFLRQWFDFGQGDPNRSLQRGRWPDVTYLETHGAL